VDSSRTIGDARAVLRLSAKGLGLSAGLVLLAHGTLLAAEIPAPTPGTAVLALAALLGVHLSGGRVVLSLLPPGEVGSHAWRDLPVTAATSLALGSLIGFLGSLDSFVHPLWILLLAALLRWLTLPGAMVPRHRPPSEPLGALDDLVALAGSIWVVYLLFVEDTRSALLWLALFVVLVHALGVARRRRGGRHAVLVLGAALCPHWFFFALTPALSLGLGASFLIPWLRRADKRAGVLAMLGFGSVFGAGPSLLGLVGPSVFFLFSHPRQRRFAGIGVALSSLFFLGAGSLAGHRAPIRGRLLWLSEIASHALDTSIWGLAWPAVLAALVLGALAFEWRSVEWKLGTIEPPRREARALLALVLLACAALAPPFSPWGEEEVLVILFPLCALLAGLLLIPEEQIPAAA